MTKRKRLRKAGNYQGSKAKTFTRGAKASGVRTSSNMEVAGNEDFNDLPKTKLDNIFNAYADAANLKGIDRRMSKTTVTGKNREDYAKNLRSVVSTAPDVIREKMGNHGVYMTHNTKTPGVPAQETVANELKPTQIMQANIEPPRYQQALNMKKEELHEPDPAKARQILEEAKKVRDELALSQEENRKFKDDILGMFAEEYVKAMGEQNDFIKDRIRRVVAQLGEDDTKTYNEKVQKAVFAIIDKHLSEPETSEPVDEGKENKEAPENIDETVASSATVGEDKTNTEEEPTPGDMLSNFQKSLRDEVGSATERKYNSESLKAAKDNLQAVIDAHPGIQLTGKLLVEGQSPSLKVSEQDIDEWGKAAAKEAGIHNPSLKQIKELGKKEATRLKKEYKKMHKLKAADKARLKQDTIDAMDALAEKLEQLPDEYAAVLDSIVIKPEKQWLGMSDNLTEANLARDEIKEYVERQKELIARREIQFHREDIASEVRREFSDKVRDDVKREAARNMALEPYNNFLERQGVTGKEADEKRREYLESKKGKEYLQRALEKVQAQSVGEFAESFETLVKQRLKKMQPEGEIEFNARMLEKKQEYLKSEEVANEAREKAIKEMESIGDAVASLDSDILTGGPKGVYPGSATLVIKPGRANNSGFDAWDATIDHELGHLKSVAWVDSLLDHLSAVSSGYHAAVVLEKDENGKEHERLVTKDLTNNKPLMDALNSVKTPEFVQFVKDWSEVSAYDVGRNTVDGHKVAVWKLKDNIDKEKAQEIMGIAFGSKYAGKQMDKLSVAIGVGVKEELAEAHRIYEHPKRDEYMATLRATGNGAVADYLSGMFGVIEKYEKRVEDGNVASNYKKLIDFKASIAKKNS